MNQALLYSAINGLFELLYFLLITRILLSWFPNINWYNQPFKFLRDITDPILIPFRKIVPAIGGIDLSPMVAFLFLNILQSLILGVVAYI